jgi:predicted  nucleic acid-binding Zn-ribbon protein
MTTGIFERTTTTVICPKCGRVFEQKRTTGAACRSCQNKNYQAFLRVVQEAETTDGAGIDQRRNDSKGERMNLTARYIGKGCFTDGEYIVAYVNPRNRPDNLAVDKTYHLEMRADSVTRKALYYVQGETA